MTTREFIQVNPTNLGDGVFSDSNGLNQIIFQIPKVPKILNGKSLRVSGTMKVLAGNSTPINEQFPNNSGNFYKDTPFDDFYIDGSTGLHSVIETLSIQSL